MIHVPDLETGSCKSLDNPELMFPVDQAGERKAKAICADCPVLLECGRYALAYNEIHGVWGGMSEQERRSISAGRRRLGVAS